jgi:hypothetical protein
MLHFLALRGGDGFKIAAKEISGYPDLCCAMPNRQTYLIEVKIDKLEVEELQRRTLRDLQSKGFFVAAICVKVTRPMNYAIKFNFDTGDVQGEIMLPCWMELIWK